MKFNITIGLVLTLFLSAACSSKMKNSEDISTIQMQKDKKGLNRMQPYTADTSAVMGGKIYKYFIQRVPCDSLAKVKNEMGDTYVDNQITLRVTCGGSTILNRIFTKKNFADYADSKFLNESVLEGIVFDRVEGNNLIFAASIGDPQTDMYTPFVMTLSSGGVLSIKSDTVMDGYDEEEEKEDSVENLQ